MPFIGQGQTNITDAGGLSSMNGSSGTFVIKQDIDASGFTTSVASFGGTLYAEINPATKMPYRIKNLGVPLFTTLTGTVKNIVIDNVIISKNGYAGAIACTANSSARIYNVGILGGSVKSNNNYCGGLVGFLDGSARVVYCYSYANITGGTSVGGIVGYNNIKTASNNLKTMIFGCMFYGDITGGTNKAPVYNGQIISNKDNKGICNYNYFRAEASYVQKNEINTYNCALMAETRFLQRFEFFRNLLNGQRELAAWWVSGNVNDKGLMMKWVMLPDSIGTTHCYPILKEWGRYPSVVNIDAEHATAGRPRNQGGKLGELAVTIEMGSGGDQFSPPDGATITTSSLTLNITDKDTAHFNFNYYKVQLPYYNDVGTKNYTGNRVVVGWKITSITGGTPGSFNPTVATADSNDAPNWNFADRNCTNKDLYSVSGRIFNQGDYWDVPEGVTAITIQPYWAKAAYVADDYRNVTYNGGMGTKYNVALGGTGGSQWFTNNTDVAFTFKGDPLTLRVYNSISNAITALSITSSHTVYDYAIVLVGNYHQYNGISNNLDVPYTLMSIDLDNDHEPDYNYILRFDSRTHIHPLRVDFLNVPGLGMAQKSTGSTGSYNFGIPKPRDWFEVTNTALFRVTQMEYSPYESGKERRKSPIILHGGVIEQWVSSQGANKPPTGDAGDRVSYFHVGDNVWFKEFHIGVHQDYKNPTPHPPISVTGGDYNEFYLTGAYRADANHYDDNTECYINGGRFGVAAGAGREGIGHATNHTNGNITWLIDNADIDEFYGGGLNFAHIAQGNINTTIRNSYVRLFCGGPKFGDMNSDKTVVTTANNCTFGTFFGAGYGGNSYNRQVPRNFSNNNLFNIPWNDWINGDTNSGDGFSGYKQEYSSTYNGVSTQINYQFLPMSGNGGNVARLFVEFVGFSLATTYNVTSTLTGCTITGNFYGGGNLGKVSGPVTSTLNSCTVYGNVYGAGYSASLPTVEVDSIGFRVEPYYYTSLGSYRTGVKGATTTYTWQQGGSIGIDKTNHILYTTVDLSNTNLGSVTGKVTLTVSGNSRIGNNIGLNAESGNVFGGGSESRVVGNTEVMIFGRTTIYGNVYGGGNKGVVTGNTRVVINQDR